MPSLSSLQTAFWPSQQSWRAFDPFAPQISPTGSQPVLPPDPFGFVHRPTGGSCWIRLQVTCVSPGGPPQQSLSLVQTSPVRRQPEAGAQTSTPVPGSTQSREQQTEAPPEQGSPSTLQPPAPGALTVMQVPAAPPVAEQIPEQQSVPA